MYILGVRIDNFGKKEILEKIEFFLTEEKFHQVATVNPEFVLQAQKDEEFKDVLNNCSLNVADGVGIWYAFIRNFAFLKARIAGVDLLDEILHMANERKLSVFLVINKNGLSTYEQIKKVIERKYPDLKIYGSDMDLVGHWSLVTGHSIVFCNFGAPHQEKFLDSQKNGRIRLAMGVGGSFDILTGKAKRAPKIMRDLGFEWLWRLLRHPSSDKTFFKKRLKRIFNAVIVFPARVLINR